MKGVSAFVATILIIAITVVIGGMISLFLTGFTSTQTGTVSQQTSNQTACAGAYISIDSVTTTKILYSNPTIQTISSINISTNDGTFVNNTVTTLGPGQAGSVSFSKGSNTSVIARGLCLSSITVMGRCSSTEACWNS
jgi:FlaG/FlaF family flagellin (archaellin)